MPGVPTSQSAMDGPVRLRPMNESDLNLVEDWLVKPHATRWWLVHDVRSDELELIRARIRGETDIATHMLIASDGEHPIGWAQWYCWDDYPAHAGAMGACPGDLGIDFVIGDPSGIGRGRGPAMMAAITRHLRRGYSESGILVGPDARSRPSRIILERNGFELLGVRSVATEATSDPIAIYRLAPENVRLASTADAADIGRLLDQFNREYDEPTPGPALLAARVSELLDAGETEVLLAGRGPDGLAVLRFQRALWDSGSECNLAELYVVPSRRGIGLGRALVIQALSRARSREAATINIFVDESDLPARYLYESVGFTNQVGGPEGPLMFFYEREL